MATALRPLTLGELLDRTFVLYRRHFVVFVGIVALPNLLVLAAQLTIVGLAIGPESPGSFIASNLGVGLLAIVIGAMVQAATLVAVSHVHLDRPVSIGGALGSIRDRVVPILGFMLIVGFAFSCAALLIAVPATLLGSLSGVALLAVGVLVIGITAVVLLPRLSLAIPVIVLERRPVTASIGRSWGLSAGGALRVLVVYVLFFVLTMVVTGVAQVPMLIAVVATAGSGPEDVPVWVAVLSQVGNFVSQSLATPLLTIAITLLYYDQRVRKEAFDLEHMMAQIDEGASGRPVMA